MHSQFCGLEYLSFSVLSYLFSLKTVLAFTRIQERKSLKKTKKQIACIGAKESHKSHGKPKKFGPSHFHSSLSGGVSPLVSGDRVKKPFNLRNKALLLHHLPPISCLSFSYFTFTFISITFTLLSFHPLPYYIHINTLTPDFFPSSHFLLYTYSSLLSLLQFPSAF